MTSWFKRPGSLSLINQKKLTQHIFEFEENILSLKENVLAVSSLINQWESQCKDLLTVSSKKELTAQHLLDLKPLLEKSKDFNRALKPLGNSVASEEGLGYFSAEL